MAWNDISSLPWMNQEQPFEAFLKGSQVGNQIAQNQLHARALGDEEAFAPLKAKLLENQAEGARLDVATKLRKQQADLGAKAGETDLADLWSKAALLPDGWANPQVQGYIGELGKKYPDVMDTPTFKEVLTNVQRAQAIKAGESALAQRTRYQDAVVGNQADRIDALNRKIDVTSADSDAKVKAAQAIAAGHDVARIKASDQAAEARKYAADQGFKAHSLEHGAKDTLNEMFYREYSEGVKSIFADFTKTPEQRQQSADQFFDHIKEKQQEHMKEKGLAPIAPASSAPSSNTGIQQPATQAEIDQYPSGTRYRIGNTVHEKN